ncbi:hypothetical protein PspLS_09014 [Pyricularia sp. CBS 133598]|nr:hypothetical protein PspLS_09014 [Pyricularia sp. CBS 133598]
MSATSSLSRQALARAWQQAPVRPTAFRTSFFARHNAASHACAYSTEAPPPPLLAQLKGDLKGAMRAKDAPRLAVLRSVLAATLNASKTGTPINTDAALVALLRKTARSYQEAADGFHAANRPDLAEKEEAQIKILDEYSAKSGIETVGEEALRTIVRAAIEGLPANKTKNVGEVMKTVLRPDGPLAGKDFEKAEVARIVKEEASK